MITASKNNKLGKFLFVLMSAILLLGTLAFLGTDDKVNALSSSSASKVIAQGNKFLGTPYRFGSSSSTTKTFDCSSFTQRVFKNALGYSLPRNSSSQAKVGSYVSRSDLQTGDLVFFTVSGKKGINHVAIYAGNNRLLHTYGSGGVKYTGLTGSWSSRYVTARRINQ
jgi:cell wall-associated NlpC family hydrolase